MQNVIIEADDVWSYFQQHKKELEKVSHIIAKNEEYGVEITLTCERNLPYFVVEADGYQYDEECATSKQDCTITVSELYERYLTDNFLIEAEAVEMESENDDDILPLLDQDDMISERELELDDAIAMLMDTVLDAGDGFPIEMQVDDIDAALDDIKEHILEYIARKYDVNIRRPMVLEDVDSGDDFFTEYPYECMEYEDEDNPIYKK